MRGRKRSDLWPPTRTADVAPNANDAPIDADAQTHAALLGLVRLLARQAAREMFEQSEGAGREDPPRTPRSNRAWEGRRLRQLRLSHRASARKRRRHHGEREIVPDEAAIVRRIFDDYRAGASLKQIAKALNAEGVCGPRGALWSPSTIHGNPERGIGILHNELYIGRLVWNRQRFLKDSDTGKRVARTNPLSERIAKAVPELRIIDDKLWQAVQARYASVQRKWKSAEEGRRFNQFRRPKYSFSGLTKCGQCGAGFLVYSREQLGCFG
jgi:hypothetical protein